MLSGYSFLALPLGCKFVATAGREASPFVMETTTSADRKVCQFATQAATMPGPRTHLSDWFCFFRQALLSLVNIGDPNLIRANEQTEYQTFAEVIIALHSIFKRQIATGNVSEISQISNIMDFLLQAVDMVAPTEEAETYVEPPLDAELKNNRAFCLLKNNPPSFSMTEPRKVYVVSDSFGCQGNKKAKTSFDKRMRQRFDDWASGWGVEIEYHIKSVATCVDIHQMITQIIADDPVANGNAKSFKHLIFICEMCNEGLYRKVHRHDPFHLTPEA